MSESLGVSLHRWQMAHPFCTALVRTSHAEWPRPHLAPVLGAAQAWRPLVSIRLACPLRRRALSQRSEWGMALWRSLGGQLRTRLLVAVPGLLID